MKTLFNKSIIAAFSFLFIIAMSPVNATENPFGMSKLASDTHLASNHEGKCGEGKCGSEKKEKCGHGDKKEGKCGEGKAKKDGKCGEGKCGDGKSEMKSKCGGE